MKNSKLIWIWYRRLLLRRLLLVHSPFPLLPSTLASVSADRDASRLPGQSGITVAEYSCDFRVACQHKHQQTFCPFTICSRVRKISRRMFPLVSLQNLYQPGEICNLVESRPLLRAERLEPKRFIGQLILLSLVLRLFAISPGFQQRP
jgi:hypothetical protein